MSSVSIILENDGARRAFDRALSEAFTVARDMIEVRTAVCGESIVKTVRTDCSEAFEIVRSALSGSAEHV